MKIKHVLISLSLGTSLLVGGDVLIDTNNEKLERLNTKPTIDTKIEAQIKKEQDIALSQKAVYESKDFIGEDAIKRKVIPYDGVNGKGYIIEYTKTISEVIDGSTTEKTYYQVIDYGDEGRTMQW